MFDVFTGWSLEEILRVNELIVMGVMILGSVFAVGAVSANTPSGAAGE